MIALKWFWLSEVQPVDDQVVWVRFAAWNYPPFIATYDYNAWGFYSDTTGIFFPEGLISKWATVPDT